MDENKELQETTQETIKEENPILEYGSSIIQTSKGTVHVLTIVGPVWHGCSTAKVSRIT